MRSSRLSVFVVGVALAIAVSVTVVGSGAAKNTAPAKVKIGYINLSDQLPFVVLVRKSIERAAKANGAELVVCDSNLDAQKAINCAAQLKLQGVKGILNFQLDSKAAPRVCAAGPKVPTVAIDIHQPPCEEVFFGASNFQAGKLAGTALGEYAKTTWNCKADAVLSLNAPTAGKVVVAPRERRARRDQGAVPGPQDRQGDDERDHGRDDPAVHRHALAVPGQAPAARGGDERRPVDRRGQGRAGVGPAR